MMFLPYRPPLAEGDQTQHPAQSKPLPPTSGLRLSPCNTISPLPLRRSVHATAAILALKDEKLMV